MVSVGEGGRYLLSSYSHRRCCMLVFVLLCCATIVFLLRQSASDFSGPGNAVIWPGHRDSSAPPFTDFIDPDQSYLPRMFYSGGLARNWTVLESAMTTTSGGEKEGPSSAYNVTVFRGQGEEHLNACVPFHAPGNRTLRICVYEREKDQMISSYLRDYGVWEKEQVEGMAFLLQRDDAYLDRAVKRGTVQVKDPDKDDTNHDTNHNTNHSRIQHRRVSESGREEGVQDQRLSVVDAGCNVGVYTLAAASQGHAVLAIDPVQSSLQLLHTSLLLTGLRDRVTLLLNALSDRPGKVHVHLDATNIGGSSVSHNRPRARGRLPTVWALCLNHLVRVVPTRRVLLKLDIEGWEARVLRCGADFFQQLDVQYVLMEWLFFRHSRSGADVVDFMVRNGLLPYTDVTQTTILSPYRYHSWPDNVWWMKR